MLKRKVLSAIFTAIIVSLIMALQVRLEGLTPPFILLYAIPAVFIYGLPVSVLSDIVTKKLYGFIRRVIAFFIHLFFGLVFNYLLNFYVLNEKGTTPFMGPFGFAPVISAIVFFLLDEYLRKKYNK